MPMQDQVSRTRIGLACLGLSVAFLTTGPRAGARQQDAATPVPAAAPTTPDEKVTVLGHHKRFEAAPMPGPAMGPPPDKPAAHLGRYKISGDQEQKDGYDNQTGTFIGPFGTAYTGASPTAGGLASHFGH